MEPVMRALPVYLVLALSSPLAAASEVVVGGVGGDGLTLAAALAAAAPGATLRVRGGVHTGPWTIDKALSLIGESGAVLDGGGRGTVVTITAPGVRLEGFTIRGSGSSLDQESSGVAVEAADVRIAGNRLEDVLFGVYLRKAPRGVVAGNRIAGKPLDLARRGDAIRVWYSDDAAILDNEVGSSRDVVLWYSKRLRIEDNRVRDGRYGLHFMYCDDASIRGNLLLDNSVGAFLMYSRRLRLIGNTIAGNHGPSGYGVGLKDMDDAVVRDNLFLGNRVGAFLDNSPREIRSTSVVEGNRFAGNDVGVVILPNVRRASFRGNAFVENQEQVAVAGAGADPEANLWQGNFWSDYAGYDVDGDGVGEIPYRAERLFEELVDRSPELRLFAHTPAARALDFAARALPVVRPRPKLVDGLPRMRAPELAGVPQLPARGGGRWGRVAVLLFALGLAPLAVARAAERRASEGDAPEPLSAGPAAPVLVARDLRVLYGELAALDGVSFAIGAGESVALWGANGAGKTTALRALLGVVPSSGGATVAGEPLPRRAKEARRRVGFLPQEVGFPGDLEVVETLELFSRLRRAPRRRVAELLAWLDLERHAEKRVGELSGGLRQRLALGVALLDEPPILFLDEPTANLDAGARAAFYRLLLELRDRGKTLLFTSHRREEVMLLADRVLGLAEGRLVADGPPETVLPPEGAGRAHVEVELPAEQVASAVRLLDGAGLVWRRLGSRLVITPGGERKLEPLVLLIRGGVVPDDLRIVYDGETT